MLNKFNTMNILLKKARGITPEKVVALEAKANKLFKAVNQEIEKNPIDNIQDNLAEQDNNEINIGPQIDPELLSAITYLKSNALVRNKYPNMLKSLSTMENDIIPKATPIPREVILLDQKEAYLRIALTKYASAGIIADYKNTMGNIVSDIKSTLNFKGAPVNPFTQPNPDTGRIPSPAINPWLLGAATGALSAGVTGLLSPDSYTNMAIAGGLGFAGGAGVGALLNTNSVLSDKSVRGVF